MSREAELYHHVEDGGQAVVCDLCHHRCTIQPGALGICRTRRNEDGRLVSRVYGRCIAMNPDPIEKKPLFHFLPATRSMSVATVGCNFRCSFCQNFQISQALRVRDGEPPGEYIEPETIVSEALRTGCRSLSFTYTEPTVFFEYALDTARLGAAEGLGSCFVSNGFMTPEAVDRIAPWLDAINVDLKGFDPEVYRKVIGGRLEGVLETLEHLHRRGVWIELTTLLIPDMNDSPEELRALTEHIAGLDPNIPWHVSRFFPNYEMMDAKPTAGPLVRRAIDLGREAGLRHIYCGNMRDDRLENTWCHHCGALLIEREGYLVSENRLGEAGDCPECGTPCAGLWQLTDNGAQEA